MAALPKKPKPLTILDDPDAPPEFIDPATCFKASPQLAAGGRFFAFFLLRRAFSVRSCPYLRFEPPCSSGALFLPQEELHMCDQMVELLPMQIARMHQRES